MSDKYPRSFIEIGNVECREAKFCFDIDRLDTLRNVGDSISADRIVSS